jgi:hypothetical protein
VQKTNLAASCSCNPAGGSCSQDCTAIPAAPGSQTIGKLHQTWHACFGALGGPNPFPGRGDRWYAFHRQFNFDFDRWREAHGYPTIESLEWCPNMVEPIGTAVTGAPTPPGCGSAQDGVGGLGTLGRRPNNAHCPQCIAFPQCLFHAGGGPMNCPTAPSPTCEIPGHSVSFPYASLDQFTNVDDVAKIMDAYFHGDMHVATSVADAPNCDPQTGNGCYNLDSLSTACAPRDPMFWRLHKAIDDVVRAWQDSKAADVVLLIDRSGSMSDPDMGSGTSKLQAALHAVDSFADLMDKNRTDGEVNRIGVVSYSDSATIDMGMTNVDTHLRDPGGPLQLALSHITSTGPGGCTGIGQALQKAVDILCPTASGGNCQGFSSATGNARKAILLMTDGIENVPPCLQPSGASGPTCGGQCFGAQFDYDKLAFTQLVDVVFGSGTDLNGPLLTLLAERQGGIYIQNPNTATDDLKNFFAKASGQLTSDFLLMDPKGTLPAAQAASQPFEYKGCSDATLTFTSGWNGQVTPGDLTLVVDNPNGDLVLAGDPGVQNSRQNLWHHLRVRLPYRSAVSGAWRGQIIRPHHQYVNGFTTDAFGDPKAGTALVRREIHRLCPQGCGNVLYYEGGRRTPDSVYLDALKFEKYAGSISAVAETPDPVQFAKALTSRKWDLILFAEMGSDVTRPYDTPLARQVCSGQRIIITDTRQRSRGALFECAGVKTTEPTNWTAILPNGDLVEHDLKLVNRGYPIFTYGLEGLAAQAYSNAQVAAVVARTDSGKDEQWFADVLGSTLAKLSPHNRTTNWKTGTVPIATVRMLPSYVRSGGWDQVDARVEVEYPTVGVGTLLARKGLGEPRKVNGELISARTATLNSITIPTAKATFPLYDDGTHGDLYAGNAYWTGELTGLGTTDGEYKLRFLFDLTKDGCTTHRELVQSYMMDVGVDPKGTKISLGSPVPIPNGWHRFNVTMIPGDSLGNLRGPGRASDAICAPKESCRVGSMVDQGKGVYSIPIEVAPDVASVDLQAFDAAFNVPMDCPNCPHLSGVVLAPDAVLNSEPSKGTVSLSGPAPKTPEGGAVVFLSSDLKRVASVPDSVVVPAGESTAVFPVTVYHVHEEPEDVTIIATYGGNSQEHQLKVSPTDKPATGTGGQPAPTVAPSMDHLRHAYPHDE